MTSSKIEAKGAMREKRCISYKNWLFTIILLTIVQFDFSIIILQSFIFTL